MIYYGATTGSGNFNRPSVASAFGGRSGAYLYARLDNSPSPSQRFTNLEEFNTRLDNYEDSTFTRNSLSGRQVIYDITVPGAASSGSVAELLILNRGNNGFLYLNSKDDYNNNVATNGLLLASGDSIQLSGPYSFIGASGFNALDVELRFNFNSNLV